VEFEFKWQDSLALIEKPTIQDHFLLLPSNLLDCEGVKEGFPTIEERMRLIRKKDISNGYIAFFNAAEIALFKNYQDSLDIVAIQIGKCGAGNNCGAVNNVFVLNTILKKWVARPDLLPIGMTHSSLYEKYSDSEKCPYYKLPQKGLVIEVRDENSDNLLEKMIWNRTRFVKFE
jgi:hypothetical protein